jgi:penicillin amidase
MIGNTHPGIPLFMFGKTAKMTWAITSALTDLSDLFRETISEDQKKYKVDGEWREFKVVKEKILVKG